MQLLCHSRTHKYHKFCVPHPTDHLLKEYKAVRVVRALSGIFSPRANPVRFQSTLMARQGPFSAGCPCQGHYKTVIGKCASWFWQRRNDWTYKRCFAWRRGDWTGQQSCVPTCEELSERAGIFHILIALQGTARWRFLVHININGLTTKNTPKYWIKFIKQEVPHKQNSLKGWTLYAMVFIPILRVVEKIFQVSGGPEIQWLYTWQ